MGCITTGYLIRDLAEVAMGVGSAEEFRDHALARLTEAVGADAGSYCSVGQDPTGLSAALIGTVAPVAQLVRAVREVTPEELQRSLVPWTQQDADVLTAERRDRLYLYRGYLAAFGITRFALRGWRAGNRMCWVTLARTGPHDRRRFFARAASILDACFPVVALGERAHGRLQSSLAQLIPKDRTPEILESLTTCEAKVVGLLERGLTNREIASLLGLSVNTVRNRVASAFKRAGASRRAELVYLLRSSN
jgi:DNA-binding CsgD family transcriptional regulator